jgi:glycosyltransferase EpsF
MQRILHITGGMDRAGAETMIMNLYRKINREQFQFDFLCFRNKKYDYEDEILSVGGEIYRIVENNPVKRVYKIWKFLRQHKEFKIVHSHTLFNTGLNLLVAKFAGVHVRIAHSHNTNRQSNKTVTDSIYEKFSKKLIKQYATNFIACGKEAAVFLFNTTNNVKLLYNAVDVDYLHSVGIRDKNYIQNNFSFNGLKIIQVGRIEKVKNHKFTIELAEYMKQRGIDFKFFIVGQGSLENMLKEETQNRELNDVVEFLGVRSDILELMAGADIMIMPSLYEGFPVVLVESQAVGLPALISDTISNEVDLGLSLVHFLSLNDTYEEWANNIVSFCETYSISYTNLQILKSRGLDINDNVKVLETIYNNSILV